MTIAAPIEITDEQYAEAGDDWIIPGKPLSEYHEFVLVNEEHICVTERAGIQEAWWDIGTDDQAVPGAHPHLYGFEIMLGKQIITYDDGSRLAYAEVWTTEAMREFLEPWPPR